ncbi:MAG: hypothetical protein WCQ16_06785 [Verrucomicrobiae bacterium]
MSTAPKAALARLRRKAESAPPATTPLAAARLEKLRLEITRLEFECELADLESRRRKGELLYLAEAQELITGATQAIADRLREQHKRIAVRLVNASVKSIETALLDDNDRTLALCAAAVAKVKGNRKI